MDGIATLLEAIAALVGAIAWPIIVLYALVKAFPHLHRLLSGQHDVQLEAPGGFKLVFTRPQIEATAALAAALAVTDAKNTTGMGSSMEPIQIADIVARIVPDSDAQERMSRAHILWVDDVPTNNRHERAALEALGAQIHLAKSTDAALDALARASYDVIITDMARPGDKTAGLTLIRRMREQKCGIPVVVYTGRALSEEAREARKAGAVGLTDQPHELLELVTTAIRKA